MSREKDMYSYFLMVTGSPEDLEAVYKNLCESAVIGDYLTPDTSMLPAYSHYHVPEKWGAIAEWDEDEIDNVLHSVALTVPNATLFLEGFNETDKLTQFEKKFHGDMFQQTRTLTTMPPLREDGDVPFAQRFEQSKAAPPQKVFLLCEEREADGIREHEILACSTDKEALQELLKAKVAKDEYGMVGNNTLDEPDYFYVEGSDYDFLSYYICEETVLTREQTLSKLQEKEYANDFAYPENLRQILLNVAEEYAKNENYGRIDCEKVADDILNDLQFRSEVKQSWWGSYSCIENENALQQAAAFCNSYLCDKVYDTPDYLTQIGAIPEFRPPENLKDIIIDCIYDVSKSHHLSVKEPEKQAERFMRDASFRETINQLFGGMSYLAPSSREFLKAVTHCTAMVMSHMAPGEQVASKEPPAKKSLHALVQNAEVRHNPPAGSGPAPKAPQR